MCSFAISSRFNGYLLDRLEPVMNRFYGKYKRPLISTALGKPAEASATRAAPQQILEIGAGTGANFRYLPARSSVIAIEPNSDMHRALRARAKQHQIDLEVVAASAESIPLSDESIDIVIATLVFCTIPDPVAALKEVHRVLRPGGRLLFLEHVAAPDQSAMWLYQKATAWLWRLMFGGCRLQQETRKIFDDSTFSKQKVDEFNLSPPVFPFVPHIYGWLEK